MCLIDMNKFFEKHLWPSKHVYSSCFVDYGFNNNKHTLYCLKYWDTPFFRTEKGTSKSVATTMGTIVFPVFVKLGLGLGFMQTSQVLPHWLNQSLSFWTLPYTQRHCHVRIEKKGPVQTVANNIRSTQFPRISLYALTLRFVLLEITKVVKPVH